MEREVRNLFDGWVRGLWNGKQRRRRFQKFLQKYPVPDSHQPDPTSNFGSSKHDLILEIVQGSASRRSAADQLLLHLFQFDEWFLSMSDILWMVIVGTFYDYGRTNESPLARWIWRHQNIRQIPLHPTIRNLPDLFVFPVDRYSPISHPFHLGDHMFNCYVSAFMCGRYDSQISLLPPPDGHEPHEDLRLAFADGRRRLLREISDLAASLLQVLPSDIRITISIITQCVIR